MPLVFRAAKLSSDFVLRRPLLSVADWTQAIQAGATAAGRPTKGLDRAVPLLFERFFSLPDVDEKQFFRVTPLNLMRVVGSEPLFYPKSQGTGKEASKIQEGSMHHGYIASLVLYHLFGAQMKEVNTAMANTNPNTSVELIGTLLPLFDNIDQESELAKLLCILQYVYRICEISPTSLEMKWTTFKSFTLGEEDVPDWTASEAPLKVPSIRREGRIEDALYARQVAFTSPNLHAESYFGAGNQASIRAFLNPDLLVAGSATCHPLTELQTLLITGSERYSKYTGYGDSFRFGGNWVDNSSYSLQSMRRRSEIVCMDATDHSLFPRGQLEPKCIKSELAKAYSAFSCPSGLQDSELTGDKTKWPIATGHWGCGRLGGDRQVKAVLQWLAASQADRDLLYYTYNDWKFTEQFSQLARKAVADGTSVGGLYECVTSALESDPDICLDATLDGGDGAAGGSVGLFEHIDKWLDKRQVPVDWPPAAVGREEEGTSLEASDDEENSPPETSTVE